MQIGNTTIEDTFAEAFRMRYCHLLITAVDEAWARVAASESTGYGSSIIACDVEAGIEGPVRPEFTPDGRPGVSVLFFGFSTDQLAKAVQTRVGQCILTCPTTAVFDGLVDAGPLQEEKLFPLGKQLRYFGDGFQRSKVVQGRRFWRIPVMDGEFVVEEICKSASGIAGGNFLIEAKTQSAGLAAAQRAVEAIQSVPQVITPFPGGVVRSGSKVGSRYKGLRASTNDAYCPTIRSRARSKLNSEAQCVYEIIINGKCRETIGEAMKTGICAACQGPDAELVVSISAGNYDGNLGEFQFFLHEVLR